MVEFEIGEGPTEIGPKSKQTSRQRWYAKGYEDGQNARRSCKYTNEECTDFIRKTADSTNPYTCGYIDGLSNIVRE